MLESSSSLMACISCGVMTSAWLWRISSRWDNAISERARTFPQKRGLGECHPPAAHGIASTGPIFALAGSAPGVHALCAAVVNNEDFAPYLCAVILTG